MRSSNKSYLSENPRGFTLTELLVAIAILIVVIIAASRIFATASQVTGIGQATSDVLTEAAAIERNLRSDIERMSYEGVLAIRNVSVRNDINGAALLLDPELPPDAELRCDQLVFFANGVEGSQNAHQTDGGTTKGQGSEAFIYYGHAYQLPGARPFLQSATSAGFGYDASPNVAMTPWRTGSVDMVQTNYHSGGGPSTSNFSWTNSGQLAIAQPGSRQWLLARQSAILGDDDSQANNADAKTVYMGQVTTARTLLYNDPLIGLQPALRNGRVDAAATGIAETRRRIISAGNWAQQRQRIIDQLVKYPRAERVAPSNHRMDQALTNLVLSGSCSSITIEWTYDLGVGEATNRNPVTGGFTTYLGVSNAGTNTPSLAYEPVGEIRWFGLPDASRGVFPYSYVTNQWPDGWTGQAQTIDPNNIEQFVSDTGNYREINYVFGFNQDKPFLNPVTGLPDASIGTPNTNVAYTPWPSALRITMVLHDPAAKLDGGRTFQFVVRLPKREQ